MNDDFLALSVFSINATVFGKIIAHSLTRYR